MRLFEKHRSSIEKAVKAIRTRNHYFHFPEHPKAYGEEEAAKGEKAWNNQKGHSFKGLLQDGSNGTVGEEVSPYTLEPLKIDYPAYPVNTLIEKAQNARVTWRTTSLEDRAGILAESLENFKERFFELAHATMHTTGQGFMMSFQASGPHAADRAMESIALGYEELTRFPESVNYEKDMGKVSAKAHKTWKPIPKGISLSIGCSTFPAWNSASGIYASLITGNPVIVKPHPGAVYPAALLVASIQKALKDNGSDPHVIQLAPDASDAPNTKDLAEHPAVKLIDYTGNTAFGNYIENLPGKTTFTEKAGVNSVILDSVTDLKAVMQNLSFSACLYSGQMCSAPQNIFIPADGIKGPDGNISYDETVQALAKSIEGLASHPKMGPGTLGALQNDKTCTRVDNAHRLGGKVILETKKIDNPDFPNARTRMPSVIELDVSQEDIYSDECFGPVVFVIKTKNTNDSLERARRLIEERGAITFAAYSTDEAMQKKITETIEETRTDVSLNFTGPVFVNTNAAFSDLHLTGGNNAGNGSFGNPRFVSGRYDWVCVRRV